MVRCSIVLYGVVWYSSIWCGEVEFYIVWYGIVLNGMVWYVNYLDAITSMITLLKV